MRATVRRVAAGFLLGAGLISLAAAQVRVEAAWVRATVPQQKATGAFMRITAEHDARLVGISSSVAGRAEIHEMLMEGEVMKMRPLAGLDLPAGKLVELKPGGHHMMLLDLKGQMSEGERVPLILTIEEGGQRRTLEVSAAVRNIVHMGKH